MGLSTPREGVRPVGRKIRQKNTRTLTSHIALHYTLIGEGWLTEETLYVGKQSCAGGAVGCMPGIYSALRPCVSGIRAGFARVRAARHGGCAQRRPRQHRNARRIATARDAALHAGRCGNIPLRAACRRHFKKPFTQPLVFRLPSVSPHPPPGRAMLYRPPPPRAAKRCLTRAAHACGRPAVLPYAAPEGRAASGAFCARGGLIMESIQPRC